MTRSVQLKQTLWIVPFNGNTVVAPVPLTGEVSAVSVAVVVDDDALGVATVLESVVAT